MCVHLQHSLKRDNYVPCFLRLSAAFKYRSLRDDNLSTNDKCPDPKVCSLRRFYCKYVGVNFCLIWHFPKITKRSHCADLCMITYQYRHLCIMTYQGEVTTAQKQCYDLMESPQNPVASALTSMMAGMTLLRCKIYFRHFATETVSKNWQIPSIRWPLFVALISLQRNSYRIKMHKLVLAIITTKVLG